MYLFVISVLAILAVIFQTYLHYKEKKEIYEMFLAKEKPEALGEYKYFKYGYPTEVEHNAEVLERLRNEQSQEEKLTPEELAKREVAKRF